MNETGRKTVGIVSVPWTGVPPESTGSIANIVHEVTSRLHDRFRFVVAAGTWMRDPSREIHGVEYAVLRDRVDRWFLDRRDAWRARMTGDEQHPFHRPGFHRHYARQAAREFARARCEAVICMVFPQWLPMLRSHLPDTDLILWCQDATSAGLPGTRAAVPAADLVLGCSEFVARQIAGEHPAEALYNGINPEVFHPDPAVERRPGLIAYAGRLTPEKGLHVLVDAFRELAAVHPDVELHLAGPFWVSDESLLRGTDPAHWNEIRALPPDYRAELLRRAGPAVDRLHLLGSLGRDELRHLYSSATVFVHPALWEEPFGMPVVEAMACGAPVVVTRRGGVPELVREGETGFIVPSGDPSAMAGAIGRILESPDLRLRLGAAAAAHASETFPWEVTARRLEDLLQRR